MYFSCIILEHDTFCDNDNVVWEDAGERFYTTHCLYHAKMSKLAASSIPLLIMKPTT